jgi:hypothetical protein
LHLPSSFGDVWSCDGILPQPDDMREIPCSTFDYHKK